MRDCFNNGSYLNVSDCLAIIAVVFIIAMAGTFNLTIYIYIYWHFVLLAYERYFPPVVSG